MMRPSAGQIAAAVEELKPAPGRFQRLAEQVARVLHPDRFSSFTGHGRSTGDVPLSGWPDAYVICSDDRIDAVEATHSDRWLRHLDEDIRKARERHGYGQVAGFFFVAWAHNPPPEEFVAARRKVIQALGVAPEAVDLVFRQRLVSLLQETRFAAVRLELLGIRTNCFPFQVVEEATHLFGGPGHFAPSKQEFADGTVHQPAILAEVNAALRQPGWALVRGLGASGKTVLAMHVALGASFGPARSFYLDLAGLDDAPGGSAEAAALDAVTMLADDGVVFVVDNLHVNEALARRLFDQWRHAPSGSSMLLLGRLTSPGRPTRGTQPPLEELDGSALRLTPSVDDIAGIYRRLARRFLPDAPRPTPPREVLGAWRQLFGGDLIAFTRALALRLERPGRQDLATSGWQLRAEDAISYVREAYVDPEHEEGGNLCRIAAVATLELETPEEGLERPRLAYSLRQGVIERVERGQGHHRRYRLLHPRLGNMILAATNEDADSRLAEVARCSPPFGLTIAGRLEALDQPARARALLAGLAQDPVALRQGFAAARLGFAVGTAQRLQRLGVMPAHTLDEALAQDAGTIAALLGRCLRSPVEHLASFLGYTSGNLPAVHKRLVAGLAAEDGVAALWATCLRSQPEHVGHFLRYLNHHLPRLHQPLVAKLASDDSVAALYRNCLRSPPGKLAHFLRYADQHLPALYDPLVAKLASDDSVAELSANCLRSQPEHLPQFLDYTRRNLPAVHKRLVAKLASDDSVAALHRNCLRSQPGEVATFLRYASRHLPVAYERLVAELSSDDSVAALHRNCLRTPLHFLAHFLAHASDHLPVAYERLVAKLASDDSLAALHRNCLQTPPADLTTFLRFASSHLPEVYDPLVAKLATSESVAAIRANCLRSSLETLTPLLGYTNRHLPAVHQRLVAELANEDSLTALRGTCLGTSLENLAAFLNAAAGAAPDVVAPLELRLEEPDSLQALAARLCAAPLQKQQAFLRTRFSELARQVLGAVSEAAWVSARADDLADSLRWLPDTASAFRDLGRADLPEALARRLVRETDSRHWHREQVGLRELSSILRLGRAATVAERAQLLDAVMTPSWLQRQATSGPTGRLAASLFSFWLHLEPQLHPRFRVLVLQQRVASDVTRMDRLGWRNLTMAIEALRLLGAASLLGIAVQDVTIKNLTADQAERVVASMRSRSAEAGRSTTLENVRLWTGLRTAAELSPVGALRVSPAMAHGALSDFESFNPMPHHATEFREVVPRSVGFEVGSSPERLT